MNCIILSGRLAQDPEVRYTQSGKAVASFNLAVNDGFGDKKTVTFIPIVAWEKLAETCGNNLSKGQRILVDGRLQIRSYEANDGNKRRVAEVVAQSIEFLERKQQASDPATEEALNSFGKDVFSDEDVPF